MIAAGDRVRTPTGRTGVVMRITHGGARARVRYDKLPSWHPRLTRADGGTAWSDACEVCLQVWQLQPA